MPSSQSEVLLGEGWTIGRPFATLEPLLTPAVLGKGPWRRGPSSALLAIEGFTPLIGTAMAGARLITVPPTMTAAPKVAPTMAVRKEVRGFMGPGGEGEALDSPVVSLSGSWIDTVLIWVNRGLEIAQARV